MASGQRRMASLDQADRKATVTKHYSSTLNQTLNMMSYSNSGHSKFYLSVKNREILLLFFGYGQTLVFNIESMSLSCPVSNVQACSVGVMMWEIFSWHALGP